jgi:hypothetical protein
MPRKSSRQANLRQPLITSPPWAPARSPHCDVRAGSSNDAFERGSCLKKEDASGRETKKRRPNRQVQAVVSKQSVRALTNQPYPCSSVLGSGLGTVRVGQRATSAARVCGRRRRRNRRPSFAASGAPR